MFFALHSMVMLSPAIWTFSLDDERDGVGVESFWQLEARNMDIFHAEGTLARLAIEVDVTVVMITFAIFLAEFIVEYAPSIFEGMHYIVLQEEG